MNLESIEFNEGLKVLGNYSFEGCISMTTLIFPSTLEYIGDHCFAACTSLTNNINLHNNIKFIGDNAFSSCYNIISITSYLNNDVYIGHNPFLCVNYLKKLIIYSNYLNFINLFSENQFIESIILDFHQSATLPSLSHLEELNNLSINCHNYSITLPSNFISSENISVSIYGNIKSIPDDSFTDANISVFIYCSLSSVKGDFLKNAKACQKIIVGPYYSGKTFGGLKITSVENICELKPSKKLSGGAIAGITLAAIAVVAGFAVGFVYIYKIRKTQNKIDNKIALEKMVFEDFG